METGASTTENVILNLMCVPLKTKVSSLFNLVEKHASLVLKKLSNRSNGNSLAAACYLSICIAAFESSVSYFMPTLEPCSIDGIEVISSSTLLAV